MIGKKIQNYEIRSHLGEGGMGTVYKATDLVLGREVALKMLHAPLLQQTQFLERFKKEARLLAQLLHPNIAVIYNLIEQDQNQFMVMEYIEGKNLDDVLKQFRILSYKMVVPVFLQALDGLGHAHKKGIFHRDLKPSNLIVTPDGTVKLMDFGIAMMAGEKRLTQVNRVVGTVEYMAPELIEGKEPSIASDIYAMGITMYELLTGKLPFEGNTDFNLMQDILKKKPVAPDKMNASIPKALNNIVIKALDKKPENRFANAKEFSIALLNAFPDLKYADISFLNQPPPTKIIQVSNQKNQVIKPTMEMGSATRPVPGYAASLSQVKRKAFAKENRVYLIAASIVILASVIIFMIAGNNSKPELLASNDLQNDSATSKNPVKEKNEQLGGDNGNVINPVNNNNILIVPENPDEKVEEKGEEKKDPVKSDPKKPVNKKEEKEKKEGDNDNNKKEEEKKEELVPVNKKEVPKEDEKKEETIKEHKTIRVTSSPDVNLYLREALSANAIQGQAIYFSVSSAVRYNGDVIIEKGAMATGLIKKVGNKKISIVITKVTAANGEMVPLQEVELSGRIADMISNRNYSVPLKKGITIQF